MPLVWVWGANIHFYGHFSASIMYTRVLPPGKFEGITSSHEANRHPKQQTQQSIGGRDRLLPGDDGLGLLI
jgi:hypothetical protein